MRGVLKALLVSAALAGPATSLATDFSDYGKDLLPREKAAIEVNGGLRLRGEGLYNLDLDRGTTPSGQGLFTVSRADPRAQWLTHAEGRLRTDISAFAPGGGVALKLRLDVFDGLVLGGSPELGTAGQTTTPGASSGQRPLDVVRIRRAYAEALTPVGLLVAGRMGGHFGLGILSNGGDCDDCDRGDASDRVAFVTPLLGHIFALAYDFSATGPTAPNHGGRLVDIDPTDDVRTATFAVLRYRDDFARARRAAAGKSTLEYGALISHRRQDNDVPAWYVGSDDEVSREPAQRVHRGFRALAADAWARWTGPGWRIEGELAVLLASAEQGSLVPGLLLRQPISSTQLGGALQSEFGAEDAPYRVGVDFGFASGDPAPGFGAFPRDGVVGVPGELDAPQLALPRDSRIDNFRFHPDYRVDRILFRELIGTVTDAMYLRPHASLRLLDLPTSRLTASIAVVGSRALHASSTPGGRTPLGIEIDPTLTWESNDGFRAVLDHALLFPLAGLDNPAQGRTAQPAQLLRLRLHYLF